MLGIVDWARKELGLWFCLYKTKHCNVETLNAVPDVNPVAFTNINYDMVGYAIVRESGIVSPMTAFVDGVFESNPPELDPCLDNIIKQLIVRTLKDKKVSYPIKVVVSGVLEEFVIERTTTKIDVGNLEIVVKEIN
jgi:hypothetical protein